MHWERLLQRSLANAHPNCVWRFNRGEDLVSRLMAAYNSPTGIPFNTIALDTLDARNPTWTRRSSTLSEFGSEQLEFVKLSQLTGNATYGQKAEYVIQLLHSKYPDKVSIASGECELKLITTVVLTECGVRAERERNSMCHGRSVDTEHAVQLHYSAVLHLYVQHCESTLSCITS